MKKFYSVLVNALAAMLTNMSVWFAVTFWVYLQTKSVLAMSVMAGVYLGTVALTGFFLGSIVDRFPKKTAMLASSIVSLALYSIAVALYLSAPAEEFRDHRSPYLWAFVLVSLFGAIAGNIRSIALSTLVTILIPEGERDKANGMVGTANGVAFLLCSFLSGLVIGYFGMLPMLIIAVAMTALVILHLLTIHIEETVIVHEDEESKKVDVPGTIRAIKLVPGLFGLIFFSTFNNFLGGSFMALMDAYGLSLVSVKVWGALWGFLSLGFIVGGLVVSSRGLGSHPLRTMFIANIVMWTICIFFTAKSSIVLLSIGMFIYLCLIPAVEAAEHTIIQRVISIERQGRVFGFAQSLEQAASPLTAFLIGPIAQYIFIPFMTDGPGARTIGPWFGVGPERGIALVFTVTGIIGLAVTLLAMRTATYRQLSKSYEENEGKEESLLQEEPAVERRPVSDSA